MRALRTGALLLAFCLAACGHAHTVTVVKPAVQPPLRPLVTVPGPAELPLYPVPELKPGSDVAATPSPTDAGSQTATPVAGAASIQPAAVNTTGGAVSAAPTAPGAPSTAAVPNAPAAAPAAEYDPDRLVGLSETDAMSLLGPPAEKADSPPSRV